MNQNAYFTLGGLMIVAVSRYILLNHTLLRVESGGRGSKELIGGEFKGLLGGGFKGLLGWWQDC